MADTYSLTVTPADRVIYLITGLTCPEELMHRVIRLKPVLATIKAVKIAKADPRSVERRVPVVVHGEKTTRTKWEKVRRSIVGDSYFVIHFRGQRQDHESAQRIAEAANVALTVIHEMLAASPIVAWPFPKRLFQGNQLSELEVFRLLDSQEEKHYWEIRSLENLLSTCFTIAPSAVAMMWKWVPFLLDSPPLFDACNFLLLSLSEFAFLGDTIREVLADPSAFPPRKEDQVRVEEAIWNAFRAIQAIIGEPNKDDRKFFQQLRAWSIDPLEPVGYYDDVEPISKKVRELQANRDSRAAHGRRGPKARREGPITYYELMDAQKVAQEIICWALDHISEAK